jgi:hypothetical protein
LRLRSNAGTESQVKTQVDMAMALRTSYIGILLGGLAALGLPLYLSPSPLAAVVANTKYKNISS